MLINKKNEIKTKKQTTYIITGFLNTDINETKPAHKKINK
jgi:hypothetical protein